MGGRLLKHTSPYGRLYRSLNISGAGIADTPAICAYRAYWRTRKDAKPKITNSKINPYADHLNKIEPTYRSGQTIDRVSNASRIYVIGDVQGDAKELVRELMEAGVIVANLGSDPTAPYFERYSLNTDLPKGTQIVFAGDYVDRGTEGMDVLDFVQDLQCQADETDGKIRIHTLRGNHEAMFLRLVELLRTTPLDKVREIFANADDFSYLLRVVLDLSHLNSAWKEFKLFGPADKAINDSGIGKLFDSNTLDSILRSYEKKFKDAYDEDKAACDRTRALIGYDPRSLANFLLRERSSFSYLVDHGEMDLWRFACEEMERDGTLDFVRSTKAAIRIDDALFIHGGPVLSVDSIDALDDYFANLLGDSKGTTALFCSWADIDVSSKTRSHALAVTKRDYSMMYHSEPVQLPGKLPAAWSLDSALSSWLTQMGSYTFYVGHRRARKILDVHEGRTDRTRGRVICVDGGLATLYTNSVGGILVIDPLGSDDEHLRYVVGERGAADTRDMSCNLRRIDILRNAYSTATALSRGEVTAPAPIREFELPLTVSNSLQIGTSKSKGNYGYLATSSSDLSFEAFIVQEFYPNGRFNGPFCAVASVIARDLFSYATSADAYPQIYEPYMPLIRGKTGSDLHTALFRATVSLAYLSGLAPGGTTVSLWDIFGSIPAPSDLETSLPSGTDRVLFRTLYYLSSYYKGDLLLLPPELLLPVCDIRSMYDSANPSSISDQIQRQIRKISERSNR